MGLIRGDIQPFEMSPSLQPLRQVPTGGRHGLRIVMVVANDVTRDSRVLREASVLASSGHRVTILGIMTARTVAPTLEVRDGYVIRRLPYRARPPDWWVPPDFYARIRYRTHRQHRIHRARLVALVRRVHRQGRLANARLKRVRYHVDRARRLLDARINRTSSYRPRDIAPTASRAISRLSRWRARVMSAVARSSTSGANRSWSVLRKAYRSPLRAWPRKSSRLVLRAWSRAAHVALLTPRSVYHHVRRASLHVLAAAMLPHTHRKTERLLGRQLAHRGRSGALLTGRAARGTARLPIGFAGAIKRGLQAWAAIVALLAWGSLYLLANRASRGALEWHTGWRWRWLGWARYVAQHAPDADVWHGHDMTSLAAVVQLKRQRGGLAVYDSHEVYLESGHHAGQPRWAKATLEKLERDLVAEVDAVITVNRSLASILGRRLRRPDITVLHNCPSRPSRSPRTSLLRRALGLRRSVPLLLYHGTFAPHRGVEQLLVAIQRPELTGAHLAFLGFGPLTDWLRMEAEDPKYGRRVHVLDAVAPDALPAWLVGVDVAVAPIQASTLNHRYSSPNKVFEAIAAGTPVAGSDFPEFRRVIADPAYGPLGTLFDPSRPKDIAVAVRGILDLPPAHRSALRRRCRRASEQRWNWETESTALVRLYEGFVRKEPVATPASAQVGVA